MSSYAKTNDGFTFVCMHAVYRNHILCDVILVHAFVARFLDVLAGLMKGEYPL